MSLTTKIIIIAIQAILTGIVTFIVIRNTKINTTAQTYLMNKCVRKTVGICKRFINDKGKWQAVYQYHTKNGRGEYITPPRSSKTSRPRIGHKITIMVNPKNPNEAYCPNEAFMQTDTAYKKTNALKFIGLFYLVMAIIAIIVITR